MKHGFFPMFGASGGLKSRLGKAAGAQPSGQMVQSHLGRCEIKNCTLLWREADLEVKMVTPNSRNAFGSYDVEKGHAPVARSTFGRQNVKNAPLSEHFWKFSC
jgi:hypothetical protein